MIPQPIDNVVYYLLDDQVLVTWDRFTVSEPEYLLYIYFQIAPYKGDSIVWDFPANALDPFIFSQGSRTKQELVVYSEDVMQVGLYRARVFGKLSPRRIPLWASYFEINVMHYCYKNKLSPDYLPENIDYIMREPASLEVNLNFKNWKQKFDDCGKVIYSLALYKSDDAVPAFIALNSKRRILTIAQTVEMEQGVYSVEVKGVIRNYFTFESYVTNVTVIC